MKYYLIAGEASGDLHGSNLMKALTEIDSNAKFRFWGGDLMAKYGGTPVKHISELAFMGFVKVILNLRTILNNINLCKNDIDSFKPDVVILIDYAGFNLKIAAYAKSKGIPVHYYISPKIWAWKTNRVKKIKQFVDKMFTILPFETEFYKQYDFNVEYVGNPVNDAIQAHRLNITPKQAFIDRNNLYEKPIIALLAGSRKQEILLMLPVMLEVSRFFPDHQFVIAGAPGINSELYDKIINNYEIPIVYDQTYDLLEHSEAALVTSGTATLETALFQVPQIVCYHTNIGNLLYKLGRKIIKVEWLSLVNIILNYEAVKELTQSTFKVNYLVKELNYILHNDAYRTNMINSYKKLHHIIGESGASKKAATGIYNAIANS